MSNWRSRIALTVLLLLIVATGWALSSIAVHDWAMKQEAEALAVHK